MKEKTMETITVERAGGTYYRHVPPHNGPSHPLVP